MVAPASILLWYFALVCFFAFGVIFAAAWKGDL